MTLVARQRLKCMSSKRKSLVMLIRVKTSGRRGLIIPVPLYVLDIYFRAIADLCLVGQGILKISSFHEYAGWSKWGKGINLSAAWEMVEEMFGELKRFGRLRMVEVKNEGNEVTIDLH